MRDCLLHMSGFQSLRFFLYLLQDSRKGKEERARQERKLRREGEETERKERRGNLRFYQILKPTLKARYRARCAIDALCRRRMSSTKLPVPVPLELLTRQNF